MYASSPANVKRGATPPSRNARSCSRASSGSYLRVSPFFTFLIGGSRDRLGRSAAALIRDDDEAESAQGDARVATRYDEGVLITDPCSTPSSCGRWGRTGAGARSIRDTPSHGPASQQKR